MSPDYIEAFRKKYCSVKTVDTDDSWENTNEELNIITACGHKPEAIEIVISRVVKNKIDILMKQYRSTEWLGYLIGDRETLRIHDMIIPKQEVSSARVDVLGPIERQDIIGVIHSHHSMGAFFSSVDDTYINGNHNLSIVVAHNGVKAVVRWTTPCGSKMLVDGKVVVERENLFDEDAFLEDAIENILEKEVTYQRQFTSNNNGNDNEASDEFADADGKARKGLKLSGLSGMSDDPDLVSEFLSLTNNV